MKLGRAILKGFWWLGSLLELIGILGGAVTPPSTGTFDKDAERKRRRTYEEWHKKHGSKWDKKP
ncbi:hypothetical protein [Erythrobacter donghaensis]|uniref:hypothetical protein n=1 Tax=Erythrobacter donghaensis TaxID=267135 RepID=UPI001302A365|nr:hypothetical protein [Erythrobacter donghaensis]